MKLKVAAAPETYPVTLTEAKDHCAIVSGSADDAYLTALIAAATAYAEQYTSRALEVTQYTLALDGFCSSAIVLPRTPLISLDSVAYVKPDNSSATMDLDDVLVEDYEELTVIRPAFSKHWPASRGYYSDVTITFTAGYAQDGSPLESMVPAGIKQAILIMVNEMYDQRADTVLGMSVEKIGLANALLNPYRTRIV